MQTVEKKKHRASTGRERLLLLLLCACGLAAALGATWWATQSELAQVAESVSTVETIFAYETAQVTGLTIQRRGEEAWTLETDEETGCLRLTGADGHLLSTATTLEMQEAAAVITVEQVVSTDPAEYAGRLTDYGLDDPQGVVTLRFSDGTERTLRIGSRSAHSSAWYYMTIDGDDRLFALSTGFVDALLVSRESLRDVTQPTIHRARIDRLTLRDGSGAIRAQWTLQGRIGDADASERWQITAPFAYPADATSVTNLLANAANLRLGAYIAPATQENLARYGFDAPRATIEIHMAAGSMGSTDMDGVYSVTDWPEATVTFVIGGAENDMVDFVRFGDDVYKSSHFTMGVFMDVDPVSTMNRYPVLTALGNLASLAVEEKGVTTTYAITRTEQVAPNNDLVYDEEGNLVWDVTVTRNGEPFDYAAFEAAYLRLTAVAAAGTIPADDVVDTEPHTVFTFTDVDGTVHTVALVSYGVLHDALSVDGHQAFYLEKGVFALDLE